VSAILSADDPYEYFDDVVSIFTGLGYRLGQRKRGDVLVQCPGHSDRGPSLHLTLKLEDARNTDTRIVAQCFGGCAYEIEQDREAWLERMLKVVFLTPADLFMQTAKSRVTQRDWPGRPLSVTGATRSETGRGLQTVAAVQTRLGRAGNWLVDRMLAVGDMSVLVAKAGIGKSTFAAQLAVCVAYGRAFLGRECKQGAVIYLAFEGVRSTLAQMVRLGHDPESAVILIHDSEADAKHPAAWLAETVKGHEPALIIIDTLADFARAAPGASNAGYEDMVAKLGAVYQWAQAEGCHVHLLHHGAKGDREGIDTALGTVGIVSKPGTVLDYRPLSKEDRAPRVLKGVKHREGDIEDLPGLVLDFDRQHGLTVAGFREDVQARELGVAIIKAVQATPGVRQSEALEAVEGRKAAKLEALRRLLAEHGGVLVKEGVASSRAFPLRLSLRPGVADPVAVWRDKYKAGIDEAARWFPANENAAPGTRMDTSDSRWFPSREVVPTPREPPQTLQNQAFSEVVPAICSISGTTSDTDHLTSDMVPVTIEDPITESPIAALALPVAAPGWCPTCSRFRCVCPGIEVTRRATDPKSPTLTCPP
jgi:hypothetical protein